MDNLPSAAADGKPPVIVTARQHYRLIDRLWPPGPLPALTGPEAIAAARRLWRLATGKSWPGTWKAGRGNHRTYPRPGRVFLVNPGQGWHDLVHDLSHAAHRRVNRGQAPHSGAHARLEALMIRHIVEQGWLDGRLRPKAKPKRPTKLPPPRFKL